MNRFLKNSKRYSIYDSYTTYMIPIFLLLMGITVVCISGFFIDKFIIQSFDPSVFLLLLILNGPWIFVLVRLLKEQYLKKLFLRFEINNDGIHCFGLGWRDFYITWESIHTYGLLGYSSSYSNKKLILLSTDKKEWAPKNLVEANRVSTSRLIIQYREDVWAALSKQLPHEMQKNMKYSIECNKDCFHKR